MDLEMSYELYKYYFVIFSAKSVKKYLIKVSSNYVQRQPQHT